MRLAVQRELKRRQEQNEADRLCGERVVAHDRGPMLWLRKYTKTENYQWMEQGLQPKEPFPHKPYPQSVLSAEPYYCPHERLDWDYFDWVMWLMLTEKRLYIPKTREMMTSWIAVAYITWFCQFFPSVGWVGQSEKDEKAKGLIKYANILYMNQPEWMRRLHPLKAGGVEGTQHKIEWANGSWFKAVPQGERQFASEHPYGYFNDESAHQPEWKVTMDVVAPAAKQVICVSSAAQSDFGIACTP